MTDEVVRAAVLILPTGEYFLFDCERYDLHTMIELWRNSVPNDVREKYLEHGIEGGVIISNMLRADFEKVPPNEAMQMMFKLAEIGVCNAAGETRH